MNYQDKYQYYLRQIPAYIDRCRQTGKRITFGYTSNLDIVIQWDVDIFNHILQKYLKSAPSVKEGDTIESMEDFARIVSFYVINGLGGEVEIASPGVCDHLESYFLTETALGGTCAQGAAALAALGIPVLAHITDKSKPVCQYLNYPTVELISEKGEISAMEAATDEAPVRHFILQFLKDDIIFIQGKEYPIPVSNRIIMDYDTIHKTLPVDSAFLAYCEEHAPFLYSYGISGFNAILDIHILEKCLGRMSRHLEAVKSKNPGCIVYLEGAHYLNSENKKMVFGKMSKHTDILGMNEEELVDFAGKMNFHVEKDDLESVLQGLSMIIQYYPVQGIVMHTKDYSLYFGSVLQGIDIEMGLTLGNLTSATRARTARYGNLAECRESLALPLSPMGMAFAKQLAGLKTDYYTCLVPSRYMEKPKYTIGLGDTFVAGMQISFIK